MVDVIYDLETYPNTFTACFCDSITKEVVIFEISDRKDERQKLFSYLRRLYVNKDRLVGFNSISFDYPILHYLLKNQHVTVKQLYAKAKGIIEAQDEDRFANLVKAKDVLIPQIDLFKIHHFDNRAKSTSLKMIEFNMRSETIEDLPFEVGTSLTDAQKDVLIEYNKHDVLKTVDFYYESLDKIKFREGLTLEHGRDFMNHNDTKIGKDYFIMKLEEVDKEACYGFNGKRRIIKQTKRDVIPLNDCIFPYIKFERPEFNAVLNWFKSQRITETKGVFSDLREDQLGDVAKYAEMDVKKIKLFKQPTPAKLKELQTKYPSGRIVEVPLKSGKTSLMWCWNQAENLNVVIDGFRFDFGTGGIHGSLSTSILSADEEWELIDLDVASYYPNMGIVNEIYPEHLGKGFCAIYKAMYLQRSVFKKQGMESSQLTLKLALNGTYGDTNNQYSPFYDPMYTMKITIGGQLSLCMLAEELMKIPSLSLVQINTDGLTVKVKREFDDQVTKVYKDWEKTTKLEMERADYSKMYIRDVNNYLAIKTDGKVKRKGAYEYEKLGFHQNQSMLVVPMAAEHYLLGKGSIEDFIRNHKEKFDFMLRVKVPRSNKLVSVDEFGIENQEQKTCRYYVSNEGVDLIKIMPPLAGGKDIKVWKDIKKDKLIETESFSQEQGLAKRIEKGTVVFVEEFHRANGERRQFIEAGYKVTTCNNMKNYKGDINYDFYIEQAKKLANLQVIKNELKAEDDSD